MGRAFEKKSFKSNAGRGGSRPGAGRPRGSRNRIARELKEMLAPFDQIGITRLEKIIREGSDKQALEGIRLAWEYRHGRPKGQVDYAEEEGSLIDGAAVLVAGGDERSYIESLRKARGGRSGPPPGYRATSPSTNRKTSRDNETTGADP